MWKLMLLFFVVFSLGACGGEGPTERAVGSQEVAEAQDQIEDTPLEDDAQFLADYARHTNFSLAASDLALQRASNPEVRTFANELRQDHQAMYDSLLVMTRANNIPLPGGMTADLRDRLENLRETSDEDFDQEYLAVMLEYHNYLKSETERIIASSQLDPIIDFARYIESQHFVHLNRARQLNEQLES